MSDEPNRYVHACGHAASVLMLVVPPDYYARHKHELNGVYVKDEDYLAAREEAKRLRQRVAELEAELKAKQE